MSIHEGYGRIDTAGRLRQEVEERERQKAAKRAAVAAQLEPALRRAEAGSVEGMREVIGLLAEANDVTVEYREVMPEGAAAFARWRSRRIVIPPIVDAETFAIALHETGHILAGECTGREPHRPDRSVTRWHHCVRCEVDAWIEAMKLVPFSRAMFAKLQSSLRTYRRTTPAAQSEIDRLDRAAGTVTWAIEHQKRRRWQWMLERQARVNASLLRKP